jgi:hypothetical protein
MGKRSRKAPPGRRPSPAKLPPAAAADGEESWLARARMSWQLAGERSKAGGTSRQRVAQLARVPKERPPAPWGAIPVSELAIAAGTVLVLIGFSRGQAHGESPLLGGLALILLTCLEFAAREHRTGFRSHSVFLAFGLVVFVHGVIAIGLQPSRSVVLVQLGLELFLFMAAVRILAAAFARVKLRSPPRVSRRGDDVPPTGERSGGASGRP